MLRFRKRLLAIAAASALSSGAANALVLGELTLNSAQNQPLDAEIELLDVRDTTAAEIVPTLAPPEDFSKAGVAYPDYLQNLVFTPVITPNGRSVVRVTSTQPLPAPVVRFLVQVMWPQGRLLRDYNLPLNRPATERPKADAAIAPAQSQAANYTTKRRDTLWQIAARNSNGGSIQQAMVAIQALNPDAFIGNNINQLKTGQVLRLPDRQQIQSIPQNEAVAEVAEQYAAWREGRRLGPRARQLDATRRGEAQAAPERIAQGDNLRLVSPGTQADGAKTDALNDQLAVAQESLDTSRRDNEELKSRMGDLQSQLDKLEKLIALKNDQLARLQAQGAAPAADPAQATVQGQAAAPGQVAPVVADPAPIAPVVEPAPAAVDTTPAAEQDTTVGEEPARGDTLGELLGNPLLLGLIAGSLFLVLLLLVLLLLRKRKADQEAEKHVRMARALEEEGPRDPDFDMPLDDDALHAPTVTLSPAVVAASAAAASADAAPAAEPDPVGQTIAQARQHLRAGQLNQAAQLLEPLVQYYPRRSEARLVLMEVYARQGDQDAFSGQEQLLPRDGRHRAEVDDLKARYPAMLALATGLSAAALAAEMDQQYVQQLLREQAEAAAQAPVTAAQASSESSRDALRDADATDAVALDDDFDLSLDKPATAAGSATAVDTRLDEVEPIADFGPALGSPAEPAAKADAQADDDFETLLAQAQLEALEPVASQASRADDPRALDDFADFDLSDTDPTEPASAPPVAQTPAADLSDDFDLSLSLDDDSPAARNFASEVDDVNAELDKLSQDLESPPLDTGAVQAGEPVDDLDFDFFSGTDEVTTKLDLARAYVDMGDHQGARDILDEVVKDGDEGQRKEAEELLGRLV
ncbi:FimV/HubP family polar landmark protein [Pseudomonas phoenicis]|uniref:FimV/HubP family polar landmark protein n=1 Tax=unclassified Pseudomonas TaxID=196821 RepID=UPI0039A083E6